MGVHFLSGLAHRHIMITTLYYRDVNSKIMSNSIMCVLIMYFERKCILQFVYCNLMYKLNDMIQIVLVNESIK